MLSFYHKTAQQHKLIKTQHPIEGGLLVAEGALSKDLENLSLLTGIHIQHLTDSLDYHEIPRLEEIQNALLLFTRHPSTQEGHHHTVPLTFVLISPYLLAISPTHTPLLQQFLQSQELVNIHTPAEYLCLLLSAIAQEFHVEIRKCRYLVMEQKKEMYKVDGEDISSLTEQEEILNQYLASLEPLQSTLEHLGKVWQKFLPSQIHPAIEDVMNSIKQSRKLCDVSIKNIRSLRDSYQIVFANKLTKTIKLLTALTILFSIPNMIASIYGMNVKLPLSGSPHAFPWLIVVMIGSSWLCGYLFYRKNWM